MKKSRIIQVLALCLCLLFTLTACNLPFDLPFGNNDGGSGEPSAFTETATIEEDRRIIPYSDMEYKRPDIEAIKTRLVELTEGIANAESFEELMELDNESSDLTEEFATMRTLAMLQNYHDVTDAYYEEEYRYCSDAGVSLGNLVNDLNRAIIEGPFANQYREHYGDYVYQSMVDALRLNSSEVESLKQRRNQLNIDYNNNLTTMTLRVDGQEYTLEDIYALAASEYETAIEYLTRFYKDNAEQFTAYYAEMIELDRETAEKLGFDSPADMYYLSYTRDYTPNDALGYVENTKKILVPMANEVSAIQTYRIPMEYDDALSTIPWAVSQVDTNLGRVWNTMMEYGVHDFEALPNKQSGGFTTTLYGYDTPFAYTNWADDLSSASTMIHEFGHFYDNWIRYDEDVVQNLDIAEVYSQGLELLMGRYYEYFTEYPDEGRQDMLSRFINPLIYQLMLEEFQQEVYKLETLDTESIAQLYTDLLDEYGYGNPTSDDLDYTWYSITHLFDAPFYTVSYWTSAVVALQIWAESQDDWDAAAKLYMDMMNAEQNQPFTQLVTSVGLKDPGDPAVLQEIADNMLSAFGLSGSRRPNAA